jgi:Tfp pilus assembly protein PilZ
MSEKERRIAKRIVISGAKVNYKLENGETGTSRLENLTKNSACIQLKQRVLSGQSIELELIIPKQPIIPVKAKIVWVLPRGGYEEGSNIGIQFKPFGKEDKYNSPETEVQLNKVMADYQ